MKMLIKQTLYKDILIFLSYFIILLILFNKIIINYYPSEDEFPLLTYSTFLYGNISLTDWISNGFSDYFKAYPEWASDNFTNFMRPIVNLTYLINSLLFNEYYQLYLIFNFLVHSFGVYLSFAIARYYFKLSSWSAIAVSGIMFLIPSFDKNFQVYPAFCFDGLAAIFSIIAIWLIIKNRIWGGSIFILVAIFTKETVIWTPFAAATLLIVKNRSLKGIVGKILIVLMPFLFWFVLRKIYFTSFSGNYAFKCDNIISVLGHLIVGILNWPTAILKENIIYDLMHSLINKRIAEAISIPLLIIVFNVISYATISVAIYKAIVNEKDNEVKMITIYILGSLMFIVFLGLEARFGYLFYLLLIPSGMHLLYASKVKFLKPIIIILFLVISLNGMYQINNNVTGDNYNNYLMDKKYSKQLVSLLKEQKDKGKIYLINDVTAICSSMESLAAFSKIQSKIIIINSISKNFKLLSQYSKNELKINFNCEPNGQCIVKMELPPQINFVFDGIAENKIKRETGKLFKRNDELNYQFPNEKIVRYKTSSGTPVYNYGQLLYLEINKVKMNDVIIYFNNGYKTIGLGELI